MGLDYRPYNDATGASRSRGRTPGCGIGLVVRQFRAMISSVVHPGTYQSLSASFLGVNSGRALEFWVLGMHTPWIHMARLKWYLINL